LQIENQQAILGQLFERRIVADQRIEALGGAVTQMVEVQGASQERTRQILEQISSSHERISEALSPHAQKEENAVSIHMSAHLQNINKQLTRLIDETEAGRRDAIAELRGDLAVLTKALRGKG